MARFLLLLAIAFATLSAGSALTCERKVFFIKTEFSCPQLGDPSDHIFCCNDDGLPKCCPTPFGELDQETVDEIVESLPKILGILFGAVVFIIVLCVVCCCCCPFCLLAKKRRNGQVIREVTVTVPAQQVAAQQAPPAGQQVQMYPTQGQPLIQPQQPYPQPQPGYPPQPQAGYPGQPQPGYPGAAPAPGYPDQPPPYTEKQPAFNPNYAQ